MAKIEKFQQQAFPAVTNEGYKEGMSLRDWFAGNAPNMPDTYTHLQAPNVLKFFPDAPELKEEDFERNIDVVAKQIIAGHVNPYSIKSHLHVGLKLYIAAYKRYLSDSKQPTLERLTAWRYAYADAMMAEREKEVCNG